MSRELILKMSMSIDGYVAGPQGETDWIFRSSSDASRAWVLELLEQAGVHAMGRKAFEIMAPYWPNSTFAMAKPMNEIPKAVFSRSGKITTLAATDAETSPLGSWQNPRVGGANLVKDIERLKQEEGRPILAHGGASFAASLIAAHLVDLFHLVVHPVALGSGMPIFGDLQKPLDLRLDDAKPFDSGVVVMTYRPSQG